MFQSSIFRTILCTSLITTALSTLGCSGASDAPAPAASSGSMTLPLVTTVNGSTYRLNAGVLVSGPESVWLQSSQDVRETRLSHTLPTGSYFASLHMWTLQKDDGRGTFLPVEARLVSPTDVPFTVFDGTDATITYRFETDGMVVTVGSGDVHVTVAVTEVAPVCTPFGAQCSAGTWCAPVELTGRPQACIQAGAVEVGQPCAGPTECVANASCFELGAGPVCAELCPSSSFDLPCASGGLCVQAGADYGVCAR